MSTKSLRFLLIFLFALISLACQRNAAESTSASNQANAPKRIEQSGDVPTVTGKDETGSSIPSSGTIPPLTGLEPQIPPSETPSLPLDSSASSSNTSAPIESPVPEKEDEKETPKRAEQSGNIPTVAGKPGLAPTEPSAGTGTIPPVTDLPPPPPPPTGTTAEKTSPNTASIPPVAETPTVPLGNTSPTANPGDGVSALAGPNVVLPQEQTEKTLDTLTFAPKLLTSTTDIYLLLDASGSMSAPYADSARTKFSILKDASTTILDQLAAQSETPRNIGVVGFGSQSPLENNNCEDTTEWYPLGELNLTEFRSRLDRQKPQGASPISKAIQLAMTHFPTGSTADRVLVLVTDGSDSCGNLCTFAQSLTQSSDPNAKKPIIQVIGFDVSSEDQIQLECLTKATDGRFFLARNENELRTSLDEAISSTVPYNLKLSIKAGNEPLPTTVSVLRAGTDQLVSKQQSFGTKLLKLAQGSYDILIEYNESPEGKVPSKLIKGVEVLQDSKVEQTVAFELASLGLSAVADDARPVGARYQILKAGTQETVATIESSGERKAFFLTPGAYDIIAEQLASGPEQFVLTEKNLSLPTGGSLDRTFRFQRGTVALRGITSQKQTIPFLFRAYKSGETEQALAVGAFPAEGGSFNLAPGTYDIVVIGQDPSSPAQARTKLSNVNVASQETTELEATFEMGTLNLRAQDSKNQPLSAHFILREHEGKEVIAEVDYLQTSKAPVSLPLPPGTYDIIAELKDSSLDPKPLVPLTNVQINNAKPTELSATFVLGTLRLMGRNAKEKPISSKFTVYMAGKDELIFSSQPTNNWIQLTLAPGLYDIRAENLESKSAQMDAHLWIRDVEVKDTQTISHEAVFTNGKIRLIGRGPNGKIIPCEFKIFEYGADRELIHGTTAEDWQTFDINPGKYYMEAAYNDPEQSVLLKKWINISIEENQILEQILRF